MARKKSYVEPQLVVRLFRTDEIDPAIAKLERRVREVEELNPQVTPFNDASVRTVEANIREAIREVFGPDSPEFRDHQHHDIWHGSINYLDPPPERQRKFAAGIPQTVTMLRGLIARIEEKREEAHSVPPAARPVPGGTGRVFIVHGHDEAAKETVARFIETLELTPVILHDQANKGRTLIEKFETNAEVDFAIVLLTPDDLARAAGAKTDLRARARQNVVFELGYFIGRLGRDHVSALHKGDIELPSDFDGVVYLPMDDGQGWRLTLARELKAAGLRVDLNLAV